MPSMKLPRLLVIFVVSSFCIPCVLVHLFAQAPDDLLWRGFQTPPDSAKPRVWWHWMNGNITTQGIELDLNWMKRTGIGGFDTIDATLDTPQVVKTRLAYMAPEWKQAFLYATQLGEQLGLEESINSSPGWSETGGPWVPPSQGMKKFVWSETRIEGDHPFTGKLSPPPSQTGPYQSIDTGKAGPRFYADSVVLAYRIPVGDLATIDDLHPVVTSSSGSVNKAILTSGDLNKTVKIPIPSPGQSCWIQYAFTQPQTIQAITLVQIANERLFGKVGGNGIKSLQVSDDGINFRVITDLPVTNFAAHTVSFPPTTARIFRVAIQRPSLPKDMPDAPREYEIAELVLHPDARVNRVEEKAAFATLPDVYALATPAVAQNSTIQTDDVIDLTAHLHPDGTLDWTPSPGQWRVIRFGYSLLGKTNHPATAEATGLEVDKLNHRYVQNYMDHYLNSYQSAVGSDRMGKHGLQYVITDSWEAGPENWTDDMIAQFTRRRGYDPRPWMPVLAGHIVQSAEASDAFLWDFRETIADLVADEHYGQIEASLKQHGLSHYGESHETGRAYIADGMQVKKLDDIPMSAMWTQLPGVNEELYNYNADDRESASVAHIYGQNLAAAESMTASKAPWGWCPATLKPTADKELAEGINRFVIHSSVHQPLLNQPPGLTLGKYGQWFNRNETWADEAAPWITYLARSSFLLQQGRFAADILYFYGEDSNLTAIFGEKSPPIPSGYAFDYINADALIHELNAHPGIITTHSGMTYRVLALDPRSQHMSLPVLAAIAQLVEDGAIVIDAKPTDDPSLADDPAHFRKLADMLFGGGTGIHHVGKGTVYAGQTLNQALATLQLPADFQYTRPLPDSNILFVHRVLADGDLYYIDNRNPHFESITATFRVQGKAPEFWHADTGASEPATYTISNGRTIVPLSLDPYGTIFVIFRKPTTGLARSLPRETRHKLAVIDGAWSLGFPPDWGAPAKAKFDTLSSWSQSSDAGIRYFSGTATYTKTINAPKDWFQAGMHFWLDLGDVENLADITINDTHIGILWKPPFSADITATLHPGDNQLSIRVTNLWVNRIIGDLQPNARQYTFSTFHPYTASSRLLLSGLLGPVQIWSSTVRP